MAVAITPRGLVVFQKLTSTTDFRVLMVLFGRLSQDYLVEGTQVGVARELGISPQSVWSSYKRLQEKDILQKERRHGVDLYYVNDDLVKKVVRMVEMPDERSEEERALDKNFALAAKYAEERRRMEAANINGVIDGGKSKAKKPAREKSEKKEKPTK